MDNEQKTIRLNDEFKFKIPVDVCVKIDWEKVYNILKEHPDLSLDGFINNIVFMWESDEEIINIY